MNSPWHQIWRAASTRSARRPSRTPGRRGFPPAAEVLEGRALLAAAGYLDTTFGPAGTGLAAVTTPGVGHTSLDVEAGLVLADGSSYAATRYLSGNSSFGVTLLKVKPDGTPDTSFGQGTGAADVTVTSGSQLEITAVVAQNDGKVLVLGNALSTGATFFRTFLVRFNPDGTPDTTFGTGGVATDGSGAGANDISQGAVELSNGEILTTGLEQDPVAGTTTLLLRLHKADGTLDPAFGNGGTVTVAGAGTSARPVPALQGGQILVSSTQGQGINGKFVVYRFNQNGTLDTSFGANGVASGPASATPNGPILVLSGNGFLQAGTIAGKGAVVRYAPNGTFDTSFGANGVARTGVVGPSNAVGPVLALAPDGKIVVGGVSNTTGSGPLDYGVTRLNPDGSPDAGFGNGGTALVANPQPNGPGLQAVNAIGVLANGNVLLTGRGLNATGSGVDELARFSGTAGPGAITITGRVFVDYNVNGSPDPNETGLAGRTVYLDLNNDGVADVGDPTTVTDGAGNYTLNVAAPGTYTVGLTTYPGDSPPIGSRTVPAASGQTLTGQDFGLQQTSTLLPIFPNAAPFGANNPDLETAEVVGLYRLVLGRDPEAQGKDYQVNQLKTGVPLSQVAYGFYHSPEYFGDVVREQYQSYLGRPASSGDLAYHLDALQKGTETVEQLAISLLSSPEAFKNVDFSDNGGFVQSLYADVLGRPASDSDLSYWVGQMNNGANRAAVASAFVHAKEADLRVINSVYSVFFARAPHQDENNFYLNELQSGARPVLNVAPGFLGSPEYNQRALLTVTQH